MAGWRENLASRAHIRAAQERAHLRGIVKNKLCWRRKNRLITELQPSLDLAKVAAGARRKLEEHDQGPDLARQGQGAGQRRQSAECALLARTGQSNMDSTEAKLVSMRTGRHMTQEELEEGSDGCV